MGIQQPENLKDLTISRNILNIYQFRFLQYLNWESTNDVMECRYRGITIKVTIKDVLLTTRGILSYTRSIFNPLVILPPIILEPKLISQSLRKQKIEWNSEIPTDLKQRFLIWKEKQQYWDAIQIPWRYGLNSSTKAELHIFYGCIYICLSCSSVLQIQQREWYHSFIMSKFRLAPIKEKTLTVAKSGSSRGL